MLPLAIAVGAGALLVSAYASSKRRRTRSSTRLYVIDSPPRVRAPRSSQRVEVVVRPRAEPDWLTAEKEVCAARGRRHHGGPGKPDCGKSIEVKHRSRPLDASVIRIEHAKGRREIVATSGYGFTPAARRVAKELGIRLRHK